MIRRSTLRLWRLGALGAVPVVLAAVVLLDLRSTAVMSMHMTQHLLLTVVAPLLLVWGHPWTVLRRALPPRSRARLDLAASARAFAWLGGAAKRPFCAWFLFCGPFLFWHLPSPYEWMLHFGAVHLLALATFFGGAVAFWAAVTALSRRRTSRRGTAMMLVMGAAMTTSLPGALMSFAPALIYRGLPDPFPICGLTALEDQQLAGLIMWIPMDAVLFGVAAWLFVGWFRESDRSATLPRHAMVLPCLIFASMFLAGCDGSSPRSLAQDIEAQNFGGDARRGETLIKQHGCGACHTIPGVAEAQGVVGPPLTAVGRRVFLAGVLHNSPENMALWLQDPQMFVPGNAMPNMDLSPKDARDLTAFLYTLR